MANEPIQQHQGGLSFIPETIGKLAYYPVELLKFGINTTANLIAFAGTTSLNLTNNLLGAVSGILQGVASVITPKK